MQTNVESLIEAARKLPRADRQRLADALAESSESLAIHRITELRGVGKDLWHGEDAQDYVNSERDSWEN